MNVTKRRDGRKKRAKYTNPYQSKHDDKKVKILRMADYFKPTVCAAATYSGDDVYEYASARTGLT